MGERADDFDRVVFRPVQGIGDNLMELNRVLTELRAQNEALRAALTQSAEKLAAAEANVRIWMQSYQDAQNETAKAEAAATAAAKKMYEKAEQVARLERTVEGMREALAWALPYAEHWATDGHPDSDEFNKARAALAASSPDHAGAPEGEGHERPPAEQQSRQATLPPSVEAGEGDK